MKVALVMPAYNESARVAGTMASILNQTRPPDEIILADGMSTDDTVEKFEVFRDHGVPLRVVENRSVFVGGGRNAGARITDADLIVHMDFSNTADPRWLEKMTRPFEQDPGLDYYGGVWHPRIETDFERIAASIVFFNDMLSLGMTEAEIQAIIAGLPEYAVPGGMCMAYRKSAWIRAGGFAEWARKGQDRLFGARMRRIGAKISFSPSAVIHYNIPDSFAQVWKQRYLYELWASRIDLPQPRFRKLLKRSLVAGIGIGLAAGVGLAWVVLPVALLAYFTLFAFRKLHRVGLKIGHGFTWKDYLLGAAILVVRDAGILAGGLLGRLDRFFRPRWRRLTRAYVEEGK